MAAIDATVIGIALPTIGRDFHASLGTLQWVVTGYTLTLASLLLLGGSLGDRFGRKRVFMIGVGWFAVASAACAVSTGSESADRHPNPPGRRGALCSRPGSLAILEASFVSDDRSEAIGAWSGLGGVATAAGPLLGGYLIAAASWRWIFLINVPLGAAVLLMSARHLPESRDPRPPVGSTCWRRFWPPCRWAPSPSPSSKGRIPGVVVHPGGPDHTGGRGGRHAIAFAGGRAPVRVDPCCRSVCSPTASSR